ncbi:MAG: alpha/beta fold hydrolase [Desulfurivibrionaceae bacterium]
MSPFVPRIDLRGHGDSGAGESCDFNILAADVIGVITTMGIAEPCLIGHSLGGVVATLISGTYGAHSVVNIDQPFQDPDLLAEIVKIREQLKGDGFSEALYNLKVFLSEGALNGDQLAMLRRFSASANREVLLSLWQPILQERFAELNAMFEAFLPTVSCPYLSLHGRAPVDGYRQWLKRLMPQVRIAHMENTGHYPFLVDPRRFIEIIREFDRAD